MKTNLFLLACMFLIPIGSNGQTTGVITVNIEEIQQEQGTIRVALFTENDKFLEIPSYNRDIPANGQKSIQLDFENIPYGVYAISIYHDLDDNGELDTNFLGIPKEPVGFSNEYKPTMSAPKFNKAKFELNKPALSQTVKMYTY
jgi:uncharacterized protein (DUF2141 family)